MKRNLAYLVVFLVVMIGISHYSAMRTDGFYPYKIPHSAPFRPDWEITPSSIPLQPIFSQSFRYLGKGHQCFVFESQDGHYILKLPIHSRFLPPLWLRNVPFFSENYRSMKMVKGHHKLNKDSRSYTLAYERLKEETALLYVHLNRTNHLQQTVVVIDKIGVPHSLDLDQVEFLVQKKAEPFLPTLEQWMEQGKTDLAKQALFQLVQLFQKSYAAGIEDRESCLEGNFGIIGEQVVQIDIGRLRESTTSYPKEILQNRLSPLCDQLQASYPDLAEYLDSTFNN